MILSHYAQGIFETGAIYAIVSLGLYITLASGQFSVAHAALMGLGGYAAAIAAVSWTFPFWATLAVGAFVGGVLGGALGLLVIRLNGMLLGITTLAVGQTAVLVITNISSLGGAAGYLGVPIRTGFWPVIGLLVAILAILSWLKRTRAGLALIVVGKDEAVARALGIAVPAVRITSFAVGGCLAGLAGALLVQYLGLVVPSSLGFTAEIPLFVYVIIGGVSTPWGAVAGAIGITWLLEALRFTGTSRYWILGVLLTATVLLRPSGVFTRRSVGRTRGPSQKSATFQHRLRREDDLHRDDHTTPAITSTEERAVR